MSQNIARRMKKSLKAQTGKSQMNFWSALQAFAQNLNFTLTSKVSDLAIYWEKYIEIWWLGPATSLEVEPQLSTPHYTPRQFAHFLFCSIPTFLGGDLFHQLCWGHWLWNFHLTHILADEKGRWILWEYPPLQQWKTVETGNRLGDREATCHTQWFCSQLLLRHPEIWNNWLECLIVAALATEKLSLCGLAD